jgi:DNA-binding GntR family transcriptional regulator
MLRQHRAIATSIVTGDADAVVEVVREHASVILAIAPEVAARHPKLFRG